MIVNDVAPERKRICLKTMTLIKLHSHYYTVYVSALSYYRVIVVYQILRIIRANEFKAVRVLVQAARADIKQCERRKLGNS